MLVSSYDGDALKPDKSVVCNVGLWLNVQSSTRGPDELSRLANVKFITVSNSKHEILNQDTRPFVLSEIHQWLVEEKII